MAVMKRSHESDITGIAFVRIPSGITQHGHYLIFIPLGLLTHPRARDSQAFKLVCCHPRT
ncbi:unnamed protein product [Tenebrio molitor]|nr:unnamed protein product [Tenebrio molitor]